MTGPTPKTVALTVLAYVFASFLVQAVSHFAVNADHYASISIMRPEPILSLGIGAMLIQGLILGLVYPTVHWADGSVRSGVFFAWILGAFLASYIALVEPSKYDVPSVGAWIGVEATASFVQFTLFGVLLGLVHRGGDERRPGTIA